MKARIMQCGAAFAFVAFLPFGGGIPRGACEVTDPTGTPLNVRSVPRGTIVRTLKNGTVVWRTGGARIDENGRPWVQITLRRDGTPIGWVFREYVSCRA